MSFTHGVADAPLRVTGTAGSETGTRSHLPAVDRHLHHGRVRLRHAGAPAARACLPEFRRSHRFDRRPPCRCQGSGTALRRRPGRVRQISRPCQEAVDCRADRHSQRARRHHRRSGDVVERQLPRERAGLHQQHSAARRRHASRRLSRRADAPGQRLCRNFRHRQEGKGDAHRRRLPRGPDGSAFGQGSGSEILLADQGQAGLLGSAAGGRKPRQRGARHLAGRASRPKRRC